jgi:hypothetical protein
MKNAPLMMNALYNALAPFGERNRKAIIFIIQKDYGIRFVGTCTTMKSDPLTPDKIRNALQSLLGVVGEQVVWRFNMELEKALLPAALVRPRLQSLPA